MQLSSLVTVAFAALAAASPLQDLQNLLEPREECVTNLNFCNKQAITPLPKKCCPGLYCCGVIGANNVCQSENNCGE